MKRIIISGFIAAIILSACNKNDLNENKIYDYKPTSNALVKLLNSYTRLTPSLGVPANGPTVDFYINNVKMNASAMGYLGLYPNFGGGFAAAPSGPVNIKAVLNRTTGTALASDTIANGNFILGVDLPHTIMLVDTFPNPTADNSILMVIPETITLPAYGNFKLRLLNLVATNEMYELFNFTTGVVVTPPVSFKNFSDWVEFSMFTPSSVYQIRVAGTTTVVASTTAVLGGNQRSITFWARGNPAVTGRTRTVGFYISK